MNNANLKDHNVRKLDLDEMDQVSAGWLLTVTCIVLRGVAMSTIPYICNDD